MVGQFTLNYFFDRDLAMLLLKKKRSLAEQLLPHTYVPACALWVLLHSCVGECASLYICLQLSVTIPLVKLSEEALLKRMRFAHSQNIFLSFLPSSFLHRLLFLFLFFYPSFFYSLFHRLHLYSSFISSTISSSVCLLLVFSPFVFFLMLICSRQHIITLSASYSKSRKGEGVVLRMC